MKKVFWMRNNYNAVVCGLLLFGLCCWNLLTPSQALSVSERRRLAQLPELSWSAVLDASWMEGFDKYATDQLAGRDTFRRIKLRVERGLLRKADSNGLFEVAGHLFKLESRLDRDSVASLCRKLMAVAGTFPEDSPIYVAMIPEKNAYLPADDGHLVLDYAALEELFLRGLPAEWNGFSLLDLLELDDYYRTDLHWRQERLQPVVAHLLRTMGAVPDPSWAAMELHSHDPFYGAYYGQMAGLATPDTLCWLNNAVLEGATLTSAEHADELLPVYDERAFEGLDGYDLFLHGAQAVLTLRNPAGTTGRSLVLFRDSFGSALAPLLLQSYDSITLVDLRYISPALLGEYVSYEGADILFLYSAALVNNSGAIRGF